jgi:beta-glucosidase
METANYDILVGASVRDLRLSGTLRICGTEGQTQNLPSYYSGRITAVSDEEFAALLGRPIPDGHWAGEIGRNDAFCQLYYAKSTLARMLHMIFEGRISKAEESGKRNLTLIFAFNMPFRGLSCHIRSFSSEMVDDFVYLCNGHFFRGTGRLIRDYFKARRRIRQFRKELKNSISPIQ